jgi:DNA-binding MarR family transcriptional regulator
MELRHLRYFCAVADWHGFNRTARALHTSQSSISAQIRDLEQEIGVTLFNRAQSHVSLTPAGEKFLEEARRLVVGPIEPWMWRNARRGGDWLALVGFPYMGNRRILSRCHSCVSEAVPRRAVIPDGDEFCDAVGGAAQRAG